VLIRAIRGKKNLESIENKKACFGKNMPLLHHSKVAQLPITYNVPNYLFPGKISNSSYNRIQNNYNKSHFCRTGMRKV
jgi:hypothetical protein